MKKLIKPVSYILAVILIALFVSTLTGCDSMKADIISLPDVEEYENCMYYDNVYSNVYCNDEVIELSKDEYLNLAYNKAFYTQDEVNEILEDYVLIDNLIIYQDNLADTLNTMPNHYVSVEDYERDIDELADYIQALEQRIIELENE